MREIWIDNAKLFLEKFGNCRINYNDWVVNESYRREIAKELGGEFTDIKKDRVPGYGGGSTFNKEGGIKINEEKLESSVDLDLFNRWRMGLKHEEYLKFFNEEVFSLVREIYPNLVGFEEVYGAWKKIGKW
jgi:hypothetical protein